MKSQIAERRRAVAYLTLLVAAVVVANAKRQAWNDLAYYDFLRRAQQGRVLIIGASPDIVRVQGNARGTNHGASSVTVTFGSAPTSGNTIIVAIWTENYVSAVLRTVSSISQTGVTWSGSGNGLQISKSDPTTLYTDNEIWLGTVGDGASTSMVVHLDGNLGTTGLVIADACEYSGLAAASSVLDKTATNSGGGPSSTTTDTGTTATTTQAAELWVGATGEYKSGVVTQSNPTNSFALLDGADYVYSSAHSSLGYLEKIVSSTGAANSGTTLSVSASWLGCIATFKAGVTTVYKDAADSGSGAESPITPSATLPITDAGQGSEVPTSQATFGISDGGTGQDSPTEGMDFLDDHALASDSFQLSLAASDLGQGSEATDFTVSLSVGDVGAGDESPAEWMYFADESHRVHVPGGVENKDVQDTGLGGETWMVQASLQLDDLGSGSDAYSLSYSFSVVDSGSGAESGSVMCSLGVGDSGSGVEGVAQQVTFSVNESGSGAERFGKDFQVFDSGLGSEVWTYQYSFSVSDSGNGSETPSLSATFTMSETGHGADLSGLNAAFTVIEVGVALEIFSKQFQITDSAQTRDRFVVRVLRKGRLQYTVRLLVTENAFDPNAFDPYVYE